MISALKSALGSPDLEADVEWVNEKCLNVLNQYKGRYPGMMEGECFTKLSEWIVERGEGKVTIKNDSVQY